MYYFEKINEQKILKSNLAQNIFFTTRSSCIMSKHENTPPEILNNKKTISEYIKIPTEKFLTCEQTHSNNIGIVDGTRKEFHNTDALILTDNNFGIYLNYADCTPIILYDVTQNIGAVIHAGWKGTVQKIGKLTTQKMITDFGSNPDNILAFIGPCISKCCFSVGEDVAEKLKNSVKNSLGIIEKRTNKIFADLKEINSRQLKEIGINKFEIAPFCTVCNNENFFSYRKENQTLFRHSAVLILK